MTTKKMRKGLDSVELISIGTELIQGEREDGNSPYLSRELSKIGLDCQQFTLIADSPLPALVQLIRKAFKRSGLVILSGGLGPTRDDVTRQALAKGLGRRLVFSSHLLREIQTNFRRKRLAMPKINERQAYLPRGGKAIPNPIGSAPGILMEDRRKVLISLPGVPRELRAMFERNVRPYLKRRFPHRTPLPSVTLRTTGLAESQVAELLEEVVERERKVTFGFYAQPGIVDVKLSVNSKTLHGEKILRIAEFAVRRRIGPFLFGRGNQPLEEAVFRLLEKRKKTIAVAESCTGGAVSSHLTRIPGSSRHFKVGVVAYSNETKFSFLKIPKRLIVRHGAVSEPVANALAQHIRRLGKTDFGLGVTGTLGPGGGTNKKPVGLVYITLASPRKHASQKYYFAGDREAIGIRVVRAALELLRRELLS